MQVCVGIEWREIKSVKWYTILTKKRLIHFKNKTIHHSNTNLEGLTYILISVPKLSIFSFSVCFFFFKYFPITLCSPFCGWAHESYRCKYSLLPSFLIHSLAILFFIFRFFHSHIFVFAFHALPGNKKKKKSFNKQKVNTEQILRSTKYHCETLFWVSSTTSQHNLYHNTYITIQYFAINHKALYSHCKQYKHNLASAFILNKWQLTKATFPYITIHIIVL